MKTFFLFAIFAFSFCYSSSQESNVYSVPFEYKSNARKAKYVSIGIVAINQILDNSLFSNIPYDIPVFKIYSVIIDKSAPNGIFYFYVGLDRSKDLKYLIVDSNMNFDFKDDKLYTFSLNDYKIKSYTEEQYALCPEIQISYKDPDQKEFLIDLFFNPFYSDKKKENYLSENDFLLDFGVFTNSYLQGTSNINNCNVVINEDKFTKSIFLLPRKLLSDNSTFRMFIQNDTVFPRSCRVGDTVSIAQRKIHLKGFEENRLLLEDLGELSDSSRVGSYFPTLYVNDLTAESIVFLNGLIKNRYVFIDFWGSWCSPCIASIPKLKDFYAKVEGRKDVLMLGIAREYNKKDLDKLKRIISEKGVKWPNLWLSDEETKISTSITNKLDIHSFPTYLIVDKDGKIVYKEESIFKTQEAIDFFMKLINKK